MAGEATQRELEELNELIARYPDSVYYEEILKQLWPNAEEINTDYPDIDRIYECHKLKYHNELTDRVMEIPARNGYSYKTISCIALTVCFLFFMGLFYLHSIDKNALDTQLIAGKGMRKNIRLPDGTMVWLNADSKLSYNSDIAHKEVRIVHLIGEAFFDVAHHQSQPFIVNTNKISVRVLGTAFNIKAYPVDKKSVATLLRGSIELSVNEQPQQKIILNPSEKFELSEGENGMLKTNVTLMIDHVTPVRIGGNEYIEEVSWKSNTLVFHNESFEDLKPRLERWFNVKIDFHSAQSKSYRFTGVFKNENIKEALTAMQLIKPFTFNLKAHDVIIY